jgi:hypothetical protein
LTISSSGPNPRERSRQPRGRRSGSLRTIRVWISAVCLSGALIRMERQAFRLLSCLLGKVFEGHMIGQLREAFGSACEKLNCSIIEFDGEEDHGRRFTGLRWSALPPTSCLSHGSDRHGRAMRPCYSRSSHSQSRPC